MAFNPEQLNFFKLSSVVLDEFPVALRQVFVYMWDTLVASPPDVPKWDDSVTVLKIFIAKEGGTKKVPMLNKSSKEWDCTALFRATLSAQTFAMLDGTGGVSTLDKLYVKPRALPPGAFHSSVNSPTGDSAETYALALDQLRLLRNTLCHQLTTRNIDKAIFDHYIMLAKDAFTALGQSTTKVDEIGNLGEEDFPSTRLQKLEDELKKEKDAAINFKQIDDHLNKIQSLVEGLKVHVTEAKTRVEDVGSEVKDLKTEMPEVRKGLEDYTSYVKTEVADVKTRVEDVGSEVKDVKTEVTHVKTQVGCVTSIGKDLKADVESVKTRLVEIQSNVQDLQRKVVDERKLRQEERAKGYSTPKSCIPEKKTQFLGRKKEIAVILSHFKDKDTRLINVCGPPAFGKTWLITEIAHQLETPVFYASLRGMTRIDDLVSRLLSVFADRNSLFQINLLSYDWLIDCLKQVQRPFALLLDDADDLLECEDAKVREDLFVLIERILQCGEVKLLIASRESLDSVIDDHAIHLERVGVLDKAASVELVKTLLPDISDSDCNQIVMVGEQVPLVIRLMCCTLKESNFSIVKLLQALEDSPLLEVLDNKRFSSIINTCFERLATQDRNTFVSLAAISTGYFDLEEARSVLHLKTVPRTELKLRSLKRKSLIDCSKDFQHCTIHSLFRSFIEEKRQTHQEIEDVFKTAQRRFYRDNLSLFEVNNEKYLTGRSNEALAAFKSRQEKIVSSLLNGARDDELYEKVVELLSTGELFLYTVFINEEVLFKAIYDAALEEARRRRKLFDTQYLSAAKSFEMWGWFSPDPQTWDYSIYSDYVCNVDCPVKLLCYHGIHQVQGGKLKEGMLSLINCVQHLSERCDEKVLKSLVLELLANCLERNQDETPSGYQQLLVNEYKMTSADEENLVSKMVDDGTFQSVRLKLTSLDFNDITHLGYFALLGRCHEEGSGELNIGKFMKESAQLFKRCEPKALDSYFNLLGIPSCSAHIDQIDLLGLETMQNYESVVRFLISQLYHATLGSVRCDFHEKQFRLASLKFTILAFKRTVNKTLKLQETVPDVDFEDLAETYFMYGCLLLLVHDLNGAIASYEQANRVRKEHAGNPVRIAATLLNIGLTYFWTNNLFEAEKALQMALDLRKSLELYEGHCFICALLAFIYEIQGNFSESIRMLQEASALREKEMGEHCNPLIALSMLSMGELYFLKGDYEAAQKESERALDMLTKLGHKGFGFACCCVTLAKIYCDSQHHTNLDLALDFCQKAVSICMELLGENEYTTQSLHLEGIIHEKMKNYQSAIEAFQKASKMKSNLFGDHESTVNSLFHLGYNHCKQGEHEAGVKAFQEAARMESNLLGNREGVELLESYRNTARIYDCLGLTQCRLGDLCGALESLREASRLRREALVEDQDPDNAMSVELINRICEVLSAGELDCD